MDLFKLKKLYLVLTVLINARFQYKLFIQKVFKRSLILQNLLKDTVQLNSILNTHFFSQYLKKD